MVIEVFISVERDAVEQRPHVAEVADRHADLADLAAGQLVVGVVAGLGRQVEGDRQAGLALGQVAPVERVGLGRRGVPGVGAHHPGLVPHGRPCGGPGMPGVATRPVSRSERSSGRDGLVHGEDRGAGGWQRSRRSSRGPASRRTTRRPASLARRSAPSSSPSPVASTPRRRRVDHQVAGAGVDGRVQRRADLGDGPTSSRPDRAISYARATLTTISPPPRQ